MSETRLHRAPHHRRRGGWLLVRALLTASVVALSGALPALAQGVAADLSGTVRDATGGVIAGAVVNVVSKDSGRLRTVESDELGYYSVPVLAVGDYRIELTADRFGAATKDVRLAVGEAARVDFELQVADVKETVLVVSASPRSSSGLGDVIDQQQIVDLPLNGRDLQQLTLLQPGVLATTNRNNSATVLPRDQARHQWGRPALQRFSPRRQHEHRLLQQRSRQRGWTDPGSRRRARISRAHRRL